MDFFLADLIRQPESESLDFKLEWHDNLAKLIHDVLCLSNSRVEVDRYIIIGIRDNGEVVGINHGANRKTQAQLSDLIRGSYFNILPSVKLETAFFDGKEIDIICIKNSLEKPYYLTKDKVDRNITCRAGVVYSRIADTNVPMNGCTDDKKVEEMYRARFRLDKTPLQRLSYLLDDLNDWVYVGDSLPTFFNAYWPEMKISQAEGDSQAFGEAWARDFTDPRAHRNQIEISYFGTVLKSLFWVSCDGGRCQFIQPSIRVLKVGNNHWRKIYYYIDGSLAQKINKLIQYKYSLHETSSIPSILAFESEDDADNFVENELPLQSVAMSYYEQTGVGDTYEEHVVHPDGRRYKIRIPR